MQYGLKPLGAEGAQETTREAVILKALQEMLAEKGIKARGVNVCAPGFHVFSKFVKLPPVDASKVTQIIQYEAQQNVPFPLEFSRMRIHTDTRAADIAQSLNARAFTVGRDVVFGAGQYHPETAKGQRLLAHELTHVVQQVNGTARNAVQRKLSVPTGLSLTLIKYKKPKAITVSRNGNIYSFPFALKNIEPDAVWYEILTSLLSSPEYFMFQGKPMKKLI